MPAEPTVRVEDVHVRYGDVHAVRGVSFTVAAGEVLGLVGGNGAGKSSTMRAIAGVLPVSSGRVHVAGHDLSTAAGVESARTVTGFCPDQGGLLRQTTVREHLRLALSFRDRLADWPRALQLTEQLDLHHQLDRPTAGFSHGMSRRLSVLLAALTASRLLVLDEPFDGVDPLGVDAAVTLIRQARDSGVSVLVSTHLLELVLGCADRILVLAGGRQVAEAAPGELRGKAGTARYRELLSGAELPPAPQHRDREPVQA